MSNARTSESDAADVRPTREHPGQGRSGRWWLAGLGIACLVVIALAPLASPDPDGLERVAQDKGFLDQARDAVYTVIPDYTVPGFEGSLSTILAGLIGVAIVFAVMYLVGRSLARRES